MLLVRSIARCRPVTEPHIVRRTFDRLVGAALEAGDTPLSRDIAITHADGKVAGLGREGGRCANGCVKKSRPPLTTCCVSSFHSRFSPLTSRRLTEITSLLSFNCYAYFLLPCAPSLLPPCMQLQRSFSPTTPSFSPSCNSLFFFLFHDYSASYPFPVQLFPFFLPSIQLFRFFLPAVHLLLQVFHYSDLRRASGEIASLLQLVTNKQDLATERVGILTHNTFDWASGVVGTWRAGGNAVLMSAHQTEAEMRHVLTDSRVRVVLTMPDFVPVLARAAEGVKTLEAALVINPQQPKTALRAVRLRRAERLPDAPLPADGLRTLVIPPREALGTAQSPDHPVEGTNERRPAFIVYTSGTTGLPKGVLLTHANLMAHVTGMQREWKWKPADRTINILPLHHIHGAVNSVITTLATGAAVEMHQGFQSSYLFDR